MAQTEGRLRRALARPNLWRKRGSERVREYEAGLAPGAQHYTVRQAVEDWLAYGLAGRSHKTVDKVRVAVPGSHRDGSGCSETP